MNFSNCDFVGAGDVRRAVVAADDIQGDVAFQNDINGIMAGLDTRNPPIQALGWMRQPVGELRGSTVTAHDVEFVPSDDS